jgi:hypothetical protein
VLGANGHTSVKRLRYIVIILYGLLFFDARSAAAQPPPRLVHVFVALADNARQGIVPVPAAIGNGDDPAKNLYWGAAFGVRTYFKKSSDWKEVATVKSPNSYILERSVFVHGASGTYLIADAYRGREIKQAITDFYRSAAGLLTEEMPPEARSASAKKDFPATAALSVYVGHDGLMDFAIENRFQGDALDGWIAGESALGTRERAATAYAKYQKRSLLRTPTLLLRPALAQREASISACLSSLLSRGPSSTCR